MEHDFDQIILREARCCGTCRNSEEERYEELACVHPGRKYGEDEPPVIVEAWQVCDAWEPMKP